MIEFRQKDFSKLRTALKKAAEDPIKLGLAAAGPAIGLANLSLNMSRKKKDTELRKDQMRAMENLTNALKESTDAKIKEAASKTKVSFRKKHPEDISRDDVITLPNPISSFKKKRKK